MIGMEACGGAHHRQLAKMGHEVKLLPGEFVKAFNIGNKKDPGDARAIWFAVQQPSKPVAVKTEMQQAMLALHRMREQLVKFRTMQINGLRGLLAEYGEVMSNGRAKLDKEIPAVLERIAQRLPAVVIDTLREQWNGLAELDQQAAQIERRMREWKKEDPSVKKVSEIPGVGLLTATASVATMGDPKAFRSGREFRRMGWYRAEADGLRRQGDPTRYIEAWRHISTHTADPRCEIGD
ncbi:transposase [Paraburkholderia sp. JPY419]